MQILKHLWFWFEFKQKVGTHYDQKEMFYLVVSLKNTNLNQFKLWTSNEVIQQIKNLDISGFDDSKKVLFVDLWLKNNDGHLANEINPFVKMKNCLKRLHQQEKQKLSKFHLENQNFRLLQVFEDISTFIFNASITIHEWFTTCGENCSKFNGYENFNNFNGTFSSVSEIIDHGNSSFIISSLSVLNTIISMSLFAAHTYAEHLN